MKNQNQGQKTKDKLYVKVSKAYKRRLEETKLNIEDVLSKVKNPYVAFSGGKDSEVVLHICLQYKPDILVLFIHQGTEFPDTEELINKLNLEWNLNLTILKPEKGLLELLEDYGAYGIKTKVEYRKGDIAKNLIKIPSLNFAEKNKCDAVFLGLRKEESLSRKVLLNYRSNFMFCEYDKLFHCNPIANWKVEDVWGYITDNELPYNSLYDKTKFLPREKIRVSPWAGGHCIAQGRILHLKFYYPDLYRKFSTIFPFVKSYT